MLVGPHPHSLSLAGAVSVNTISGHARARLIDTQATFATTDEDEDPGTWPSDFRTDVLLHAADD